MGGPPPEASQTYCLRWNNHKTNLIEILDALIKHECYVDCTIVVDDKVTFKAHRVVLAANSPYFQAILRDAPMDHCSILFPGVNAFEMRILLEYMYTGEVNVTQNQIPRIMRIAEELEIKGLFDMADLKEKFNKLTEDTNVSNPYTQTSTAPYTTDIGVSHPQDLIERANSNGAKELQDTPPQSQNSSAVISSTHISPSVTANSNRNSPSYNSYTAAAFPSMSTLAETATTATQPVIQSSTPSNNEHTHSAQWPLSPTSAAAAAAMLSSVYESAPDMNPLKRKKMSSISSMLMNRDTPILRNVLAQANQPDTQQVIPLMLPGATSTNTGNGHASGSGSSAGRSNDKPNEKPNNSFNGSDFAGDKKYPDEVHSPFTDRSFDDDNYDQKGNYSGNLCSSSANQKPEWKRYKQYTRNDIMSAIQCVRDGMSALQASRKFGVPSRTLYDKVKKLGITTGRPMNRSMKRSPNSIDNSAAFPYSHGYGTSEVLLTGIHEGRNGAEERESLKEHQRVMDHSHLSASIPHPAAALLDHAFLQQALENRAGGDMAGRDALHAMALAAAAHAAANRMNSSEGPNGNVAGRRSPSPGSYSSTLKYANIARNSEHEQDLQRLEMEEQRSYEEEERYADDEADQVEDLSVQRRREDNSPSTEPETYSPTSSHYGLKNSGSGGSGVIMSTNALAAINCTTSSGELAQESTQKDEEMCDLSDTKRDLVIDEDRAD